MTRETENYYNLLQFAQELSDLKVPYKLSVRNDTTTVSFKATANTEDWKYITGRAA